MWIWKTWPDKMYSIWLLYWATIKWRMLYWNIKLELFVSRLVTSWCVSDIDVSRCNVLTNTRLEVARWTVSVGTRYKFLVTSSLRTCTVSWSCRTRLLIQRISIWQAELHSFAVVDTRGGGNMGNLTFPSEEKNEWCPARIENASKFRKLIRHFSL